MSEGTFTCDVFLSHSSKDKAIVRDIAERLKKDGLKVWFDEWCIKPGDSIPSKVDEGLENSRVLVLCMSANAFGSDWAQLESHTFRFRDPLNKERRFLSVRLDDAPIKGSLAQFLYISWLPTVREHAYVKLFEACQRSENRKPVGQLLSEKPIPVSMQAEQNDHLQVGGVLLPNFHFYVERQADKELDCLVSNCRAAALISGPRMIGKTSLLQRQIVKLRKQGRLCVVMDFQGIGDLDFSTTLRELTKRIAKQVGEGKIFSLVSETEAKEPSIREQFFEVLEQVTSPIVLAFDEVDALKTTGCSDQFFSFLRSIYFRQVIEPSPPVTLLIASVLPAWRLQEDKRVSPFNVGSSFTLGSFTIAEAETLLRHSCSDISSEGIDRLYRLTGGYPFLVHAAARLLSTGSSVSDVCANVQHRDSSFNLFIQLGRAELSRNPRRQEALHKFTAGRSLSEEEQDDLIDQGFLIRNAQEICFASDIHRTIACDMIAWLPKT